MGKKKNKNKVSGAVKTAAKTEKKLTMKLKKELASLGEDDIDNILAKLEQEEAKKHKIVENILVNKTPEPRAFATLTAHPTNTSELILFGGEYHDGQKTLTYNELLIYNSSQNEWRSVKAPAAPPPRSAHQAVATAANKGELWIFGGEFTSKTETQFHHYKDLWCFSLSERKWEKIQSPNGPSARSGHRMIALGKKLFVFGGYTDNGRDYRYYNDIYVFCTETRNWTKLEPAGHGPSPRSGCILMPLGNDTLLVYGGYCRVKIGKCEKGVTYRDLYKLNQTSVGDWKWSEVSGGGGGNVSGSRSGLAVAVNAPNKKAYVFGGAMDVNETEDDLSSEMLNQLQTLDLETNRWYNVIMNKSQQTVLTDDKRTEQAEDIQMEEDTLVTVKTDEVFTMTFGGPSTQAPEENGKRKEDPVADNGPSGRMNAMMAIQKSVLYVYGGIYEKGEKQFTLNDMYALNLHKLNGWKTIISQVGLPEWLGSSDDDSGSDDDSYSDTNSEVESD